MNPAENRDMGLRNRSLFIVEDNLQNRLIYQMALRHYEVTIHFERWGRGSVQQLGAMPRVDLILLDLMLAEGISGFDIFDQIRALPEYAAVPIVAISAMDPAVAIPKARSKGFSGFIAKPIVNDLFPQQLAAILAGETIWHIGERTW